MRKKDDKKTVEPVFTIPDRMYGDLPQYDRDSPFVVSADGNAVVAGKYALIIGDSSGITDSGMWHEVQYASWNAKTRELSIVWVDPVRPHHQMVTLDDNPKRFMERVTSRVNDTIVLTKQTQTDSGALITASVRRRIDGELFSTAIIRGNRSHDDERQAEKLESEVRKEVQLEA